MENASRALIIAGGILIAILVVSLLVTGWNNFTNYSRTQEQVQTVEQIVQFNKEFESYNKGVIRGYELVSLENLAEDTNERYEEINGYKNLEVYIKFMKNTTLADNLGDDKTQRRLTESYIDLITFMNEDYNYIVENVQKDFPKIFKEAYFQCDRLVYDGENEEDNGKGSGRVQKMYFSQIVRKN